MRGSVEIDCKLLQNATLPLENEEDVVKMEQSLNDAEGKEEPVLEVLPKSMMWEVLHCLQVLFHINGFLGIFLDTSNLLLALTFVLLFSFVLN